MRQALDTLPINLKGLSDYFRAGIKQPSHLMVGVEWEKIGVYKDTGRAISYSGPHGVETILKALISQYQWTAVESENHIIALKKNGTSVTLEPGGQIELSGQKAATLRENEKELQTHLAEIKKVSEPLGIVWLGTGVQPISRLDEIEWTPKKRYDIMREYLKIRGPMTYDMMKKTASVQVSIDYTSEADAIEKLRLATGLAPIFSAIFANSAIANGQPSGFYSMRSQIWRQTDPDRTGLIEPLFQPGFNFDAYRDYAMDVPMIFIIRDQNWVPMNGITFRSFFEKGHKGMVATAGDWEMHLTTIFTEVRLKTYIEIRSIDCQKTSLGLSAAALIKGLFYHTNARRDAEKLIENTSPKDRSRLMREVPERGLYTAFKGKNLWGLAEKLILLAEGGLNTDDRPYLEPLKKLILNDHKMPAEMLLECFDEDGTEKEKVSALIRCAAL